MANCPSVERIREELFTGGFRPMNERDFFAYGGAELGDLICDLKIGRFHYDVLFSVGTGTVQIFDYNQEEPNVWEMDLSNGSVLEL